LEIRKRTRILCRALRSRTLTDKAPLFVISGRDDPCGQTGERIRFVEDSCRGVDVRKTFSSEGKVSQAHGTSSGDEGFGGVLERHWDLAGQSQAQPKGVLSLSEIAVEAWACAFWYRPDEFVLMRKGLVSWLHASDLRSEMRRFGRASSRIVDTHQHPELDSRVSKRSSCGRLRSLGVEDVDGDAVPAVTGLIRGTKPGRTKW